MPYTVKKGDTLGKIAAANGVTVAEIVKLNPVIKNPDLISIGWKLALPGEADPVPTAAKPKATVDPSTQKFKGRALNNVPGRPEVWKVGNKTFLVYLMPDSEADPVYLAWEAPGKSDVQSFFGPGKTIVYDRTVSTAQWKSMGVLDFGSTDEIPPGADNPFSSWESTLDVQSQTQPWILDDDYQALMASALIEGREITESEIQTTAWWKTHNASERNWMLVYHSDPETAQALKEDRRRQVRDMFIQAGAGQDVAAGVVNFVADNWMMGHWTQAYTNDQVRALTDPYSGVSVDANLAKRKDLATVGKTAEAEDRVRDLLSTWLGPAFGDWSQSEIARIAGDIRNDPDAESAFVESLKDQRMVVLPEHTDRNTSYAAIANTWRQWWLGQWGQMPDEKDDLFIKVLRNNDTDVSARLLRSEGLARGISKVAASFSEQGLNKLGDSERRVLSA